MVSVDRISNVSFIVPDDDNDFIDVESSTLTPPRIFHKNRLAVKFILTPKNNAYSSMLLTQAARPIHLSSSYEFTDP